MSDARPTLWQIPVSHYSEKVRWALAWKGVEHRRRSPQPPFHMAAALWLTRGAHHTFPVLRIDGEGIGDSTAIIAELERRFPDPPLYPADPAERRRVLQLEDFFDEELGPDLRLLAWHKFGTIASASASPTSPPPRSSTPSPARGRPDPARPAAARGLRPLPRAAARATAATSGSRRRTAATAARATPRPPPKHVPGLKRHIGCLSPGTSDN